MPPFAPHLCLWKTPLNQLEIPNADRNRHLPPAMGMSLPRSPQNDQLQLSADGVFSDHHRLLFGYVGEIALPHPADAHPRSSTHVKTFFALTSDVCHKP